MPPLPLQQQELCTDDADCSYNGACDGGACVCRSPWRGTRCEVLVRGAVAASSGYQSPRDPALPVTRTNFSSWGGSVLLGDDGIYHMYAAEMLNGCGIDYWEPNSRVVHAVAPSPSGPFVYSDEVLAAFAHEVSNNRASPSERCAARPYAARPCPALPAESSLNYPRRRAKTSPRANVLAIWT